MGGLGRRRVLGYVRGREGVRIWGLGDIRIWGVGKRPGLGV